MSFCLGKWSNFIRRRDKYLFETLAIKRVFSEVQGKEGSFPAELNGEIPMTLNIGSEIKVKDTDVRDNRESNRWM